jgi:hypothetical protein
MSQGHPSEASSVKAIALSYAGAVRALSSKNLENQSLKAVGGLRSTAKPTSSKSPMSSSSASASSPQLVSGTSSPQRGSCASQAKKVEALAVSVGKKDASSASTAGSHARVSIDRNSGPDAA